MRNVKGQRLLPFILALCLAVSSAAVLTGCGASPAGAYDPESDQMVTINIPSGSSAGKIGSILEENGIIADGEQFRKAAKVEGYDSRFMAGTYTLSPSMTELEIMDIIAGGKVDTKRFTVIEGLTVDATADRLSAEGIVDRDAFMHEVQYGEFSQKFVPYLPAGKDRLEGFLFPETYDVYSTATAHDVIDRMLTQFDTVYNDEYYTRATELGLNINEVITIASMIESETKVNSEKPLVASVIYNRLSIDMPLQIDATVQYAKGEHTEIVTNADLKTDSPYNTYMYKGLPPGPICSPGEQSIIAALWPEDTDYIYYVLSEKLDGTHNFSTNFSDFSKDKERYNAALK